MSLYQNVSNEWTFIANHIGNAEKRFLPTALPAEINMTDGKEKCVCGVAIIKFHIKIGGRNFHGTKCVLLENATTLRKKKETC